MAIPYFAFPVMLIAGLDQLRSKIESREPIDRDRYELA
jgi:glutamine synthetase